MNKWLVICFFLIVNCLSFSQMVVDTVFDSRIKSVFFYPLGNELSQPLLALEYGSETNESLLLRFDLLGEHYESFSYRITHCTYDWTADDLSPVDFMNGPAEGSIDDYQFSFTTRQPYVNYSLSLPGSFSHFTASGNYLLEVLLDDEVVISRRFCVFEYSMDVSCSIAKPTASFGNVLKDQELSVGITPRKGSFLPSNPPYYKIVAQQNGRLDNARYLSFSGYSGDALMFQWQQANVFPGGNCFRYFDISDLNANMFHVQRVERWGGELFAFLQPDEDRSSKPYSYYASLNGGSKINIRNRRNPDIEADYVWVNFALPMTEPILGGSVHIVGALCDWSLGEISAMDWNPQANAYTKRLYLKQGYYSYQILFRPDGLPYGLTDTFEGNHFATRNDYTIFAYLLQPGRLYDRLVGIARSSVVY